MKLICEGLDLSDAVLKVIKATANRTTNPILEGIKIKASQDSLTLTATDLEISIEKTIPADVKIEGEIVVGVLEDKFVLVVEGNYVYLEKFTIKTKKGESRNICSPPTMFCIIFR